MGNGSYQLTSAGRPAHGWQIGWHWLAGNSYFPSKRIFSFCFLNPLASILEDMRVWCITLDFLFKSVWAWCAKCSNFSISIFRSGYNAGGSPSYIDTTSMNPQFHIQIPRSPSLSKCHVVVSVTQQYETNTGKVSNKSEC